MPLVAKRSGHATRKNRRHRSSRRGIDERPLYLETLGIAKMSSSNAVDDAADPLLDGGGGGGGDSPSSPRRRRQRGLGATPTATTLILLGDMFGLGALSLPSVFARLGWLPATFLLLLFSAATVYSGRLFALLCALAPRARVFDDYGALALGDWGRRLTYLGVYLCIFFEPPIFAVTVAESLRVLGIATSNISTAAATTLIMVPLAQVRELEGVAAFSSVGVAGMAVAAAAAVACLLGFPNALPAEIKQKRQPTRLVRSSGVGAASLAAALFDVVFTFGGQVNWNRYTTGMADSSQFPRCVAVAVALMTGAYAAVGGVGYAILGQDFDYSRPLTSLLPPGVDVVVANVGLLAHTLLAFQINVNGECEVETRAFFFHCLSFFVFLTFLSLSLDNSAHHRRKKKNIKKSFFSPSVWTHLCLHLTCAAPLEDDDDDSSSDEGEGGDAAAAAAEGGAGGGGEGDTNAPPSPPPPPPHHHHDRHRLRWAVASTLCVLYSVAVAALLPFFSSLMAVIASLGDLAGAYALPALFALVLIEQQRKKRGGRGGEQEAASAAGGGSSPPPFMGKTEALLCKTVLIPGSLALSAVGMVLSVRALLDDMEGGAGGFAVAGRLRWWWK